MPWVAGASPIALGSVLVVLHGDAGRWKGVGFATGVVLRSTRTLRSRLRRRKCSRTKGAVMRTKFCAQSSSFALGIAMLTAAAYLRSRPASSEPAPSHRFSRDPSTGSPD